MNHEKNKSSPILTVVVGFFMLSIPMFAHHGSGISCDSWTTKAAVTDWKFTNPQPVLLFDITDEKEVSLIGIPNRSAQHIRHINMFAATTT